MTLPDSEGPEFHKWTWLSGGVRLPSSYEIGIVDLKVRDYWDRKRERELMREWKRGNLNNRSKEKHLARQDSVWRGQAAASQGGCKAGPLREDCGGGAVFRLIQFAHRRHCTLWQPFYGRFRRWISAEKTAP